MQHRELSPEVISSYSSMLQRYSCREATSFDAYSRSGTAHEGSNQSCYANLPQNVKQNDDNCAVLYNGYCTPIMPWDKIETLPVEMGHMVKGYGLAAGRWLTFLLNPEGPFKELLPFMYETQPEDILLRRGFIFHNLVEANFDLMLMLCSISRMPSEHPKTFQHFHYLTTGPRKVPPRIAAWIALTMVPEDYKGEATRPDGKWMHARMGHGSAFGAEGMLPEYAKGFLNGKTQPMRTDERAGMANCQFVFRDTAAYTNHPRKLVEWVNLLADIMEVKNVKKEALPAAA